MELRNSHGPQNSSRSASPSLGVLVFRVLLVILLCINAVLMWRVLRSSGEDTSTKLTAGSSASGSGSQRQRKGAKKGGRAVEARGDLASAEKTTVEIFKKNAPTVVFITTVALREDLLRRNVSEIPRGTGSGFLWDEKGHVVTNFHVIQNANGAKVTLEDQSVWDATLVGAAADKDLAVLKIKAPQAKLAPIALGNSDNLVVGQHVFAIGNPFGFDHTLSTGVISGLNREIMSVSRRPIQGVIQTDAAINPGNSGGPLIDSAGRLIGVNTAIYSPSGAHAGIGFAVPASTVRRIVPQLIEHGKVIRPWLGIQIADSAVAARFGVKGVLILGVVDGSPASKAKLIPVRRNERTGGFVIGDVIVGIDGQKIDGPDDLFRILDRKAVGQKVAVKVSRNKKVRSVPMQLTEMPD